MIAYLIRHAGGQRGDALIDGDGSELYAHFTDGWVVITNSALSGKGAVHYAVPRDQVASVERIDEHVVSDECAQPRRCIPLISLTDPSSPRGVGASGAP